VTLAQFTVPLTGFAILIATAFMGFIAFEVAHRMWTGKIDLSHLIAEDNGHTSFSRFQMLMFTFVIASIYLVYALYGLSTNSGAGLMLPEIPNGVLGLIGISGGSYIGAKVIQKVGEAPKTDQVAPQTQAAVAPAQPQPLTQPQPTMP
jgi:ribose/xylose/arabinose/galactoside ABC-type transport system permease subunit